MNFKWVEISKVHYELFYNGDYIGHVRESISPPGCYFYSHLNNQMGHFDLFEECKDVFMESMKNYFGVRDYVEINREEGLIVYEF